MSEPLDSLHGISNERSPGPSPGGARVRRRERGPGQDARRHVAADREAVRQGRRDEARRASDGGRISVVPTGSLALDLALGVGGIPRGRIVEVFGPEARARPPSVCTSSRRRRRAASPRSSTPNTRSIPPYARELGVNIDELLVPQPDSGEQALEIADMLVRSAALDLVVIDSVAALVPRRDRGRDGRYPRGAAGAVDVPGDAQALRVAVPLRHHGIFINQLRRRSA